VLTRPDPPKSGKIVTRPDPTRGSIRPVDNSDTTCILSSICRFDRIYWFIPSNVRSLVWSLFVRQFGRSSVRSYMPELFFRLFVHSIVWIQTSRSQALKLQHISTADSDDRRRSWCRLTKTVNARDVGCHCIWLHLTRLNSRAVYMNTDIREDPWWYIRSWNSVFWTLNHSSMIRS